MAVNKKLLQGAAAAAPGGLTPSEHFGVVLYEGDGSSSHSINGGKFGAGAYFNGSNCNITPSGFTSDQLGPNGEMSISWWMNTPINDTTVAFICEGDTDSEYMVHLGGSNTRGMRIAFAAATTNVLDVNNAFTANTWQHFVAIMTPTGNKLYRDGSLVGSNTFSETRTDFSTFYIGSRRNSSLRFEGKLDQVRIFAKELSSSEVSTLYAETVETVTDVTPLGDNDGVSIGTLQGAYNTYRFEDNVNDENNNTNGTAYNITYDSNGKFGKAASFNGSTSYIDLGTVSRASSMTLSAWVKTTGNNLPIVYLDNGAVFRINILPSGVAGGGNLSGTDLSGSTPINDNNWHHILVIFNDGSGNKLLYVDGVLENSQSYSSGSRTYKDGIGIDNNNPASAAILIDQVRIFKTALTPGQVKAIYTENSLTTSYRFEGNANDDMNIADGTASNVTYEYGLNFTPDLVWIKNRTTTGYEHFWWDSTRGAGGNKSINSDSANAEGTENTAAYGYLSSFDTGGFTLNTGTVNAVTVNKDGDDYVAWCFKANGGTTSSNTDGTITSTVQANTDAGFSIVTYTGNGTQPSSIGHGLNSAPTVVMNKCLSLAGTNWHVYTSSTGATSSLVLNDTAAAYTGVGEWNTAPDSTRIYVGNTNTNASGRSYISYCFHDVEGFSKFGSYTGNGSTNGPIVETGFEPAFVMVKGSSLVSQWNIVDNKRDTTNPATHRLFANLSNAEATGIDALNFLSNGFQIANNDAGYNGNNDTYIYMAFAADPDTEAPTVAKSFTTKTYTGTGSAQSIDGFGFKPNLLYIKRRTGASGPNMTNSVTGIDFYMFTDSRTNFGTDVNHLGSFDDDGFTTAGGGNAVNGIGEDYVAWAWKADDNESTIEKVTSDLNAVAVYKFEDNVNDVTSTYNGTATDITYNSSGKFNKSAIFNGSSSKVTVGNWGLTSNRDFSTSFWFKADSLSGDQWLYGQGANSGNFDAHSIYLRNNTTIFHDNRGNSDALSTSLSLSTGTWYHFAYTYNASTGVHTGYINGASIGTATRTLDLQSNNSGGAIGTREISGSYYFDGEIDQFRVYHATLTSSDITTLYNETASDNDDLNLGMTYVSSIESIVSANANAGFSIVKYTGNGLANQRVPHGLSAAPELIIAKAFIDSSWVVYTATTGTNKFLELNNDAQEQTISNYWGTSSPSATTFGVAQSNANNNSTGNDIIAYCFHSVSGFSKIGTYTGTGSSIDNNITTLGFRPDFVMIKRTDSTGNWVIGDSVREVNGQITLLADSNAAESNQAGDDIALLLDNGFRVRTNLRVNASGGTFIYMAFKIN